ncbi:hypothetical protein SAICODRAFT_6535 [Saitoella complicata NRRL Y-17804]|uniref:uncharacterized protein n=1 Tax=Saitoella complicata (strain BCRC 22490 / CBS 7301 / JCM 7358 / NBRC 10748 / NRRL Y-17804) TaxID=698492 RepID=UPI000866F939|nr:uncharacterized protein SAICODRAFT_6535 [Saitoella complicata NRRL Y-17804]ODQ54252.1 hypothetical protein SAICODRAFT_6535 [Saitoella complicata NRRL Y-17804]
MASTMDIPRTLRAPLYPLLGIPRLLTTSTLLKPIAFTSAIAAGVTGVWVKYAFGPTLYLVRSEWFGWLIPFKSYTKIMGQIFWRGVDLVKYVSSSSTNSKLEQWGFGVLDKMRALDTQWWMAVVFTLIQAGVVVNYLVGWRIRAEAAKVGHAVLAAERAKNRTSSSSTVKAVEEKEVVKPTPAPKQKGNWIMRYTVNQIKSLLMTPIYAIPVLGQLLYAYTRAPQIASSYLLPLDPVLARRLLNDPKEEWSVRGFGLVAGMLGGVPILGSLFRVGSMVGGAMLLAEVERGRRE